MKGVDLLDALFDLLIEENGEISVANRIMEDRNSQMIWSVAIPSSDGGGTAKPGEGTRRVRPTAYSGFSDALVWVREKKLVTLEDMIRKMTSFPARTLRLWDRGLIKEGLQADITVFDFENVKSLCTYENDARPAYPEGIPYVIVNGVPVIDDNPLTGTRTTPLRKLSGFTWLVVAQPGVFDDNQPVWTPRHRAVVNSVQSGA